jgi:hypothetical protein
MASNKSDDQLKQELLDLARSGAPRPRLDSDDPEERELAEALLRFTSGVARPVEGEPTMKSHGRSGHKTVKVLMGQKIVLLAVMLAA